MKNKYWILLFVFLAALCLVVGLFLPQEGKPATHAQIRNAELDITVDLSEDQEFTVKASDGGFRTSLTRTVWRLFGGLKLRCCLHFRCKKR